MIRSIAASLLAGFVALAIPTARAQCPTSGSCYAAHPGPGCVDAVCCNIVCAADPFCCAAGWDDVCAGEAADLCGGCGGPETTSCFIAGSGSGCANAACCGQVCAVDAYCCDVIWDGVCAGEAAAICGGCGDAAADSCFAPDATPGCSDSSCCAFICSIDPFCCETAWDQACANEALGGCAPPNDPCEHAIPIVEGQTSFFTYNATGPGEACSQMGADIWFRYTALCSGNIIISTCGAANFDTVLAVYSACTCDPVALADSLIKCNDDDISHDCGQTSQLLIPIVTGQCYTIRLGGYMGAVGEGTLSIECVPCGNESCFQPHFFSTGCNDADCCAAVCLQDPFCCSDEWDNVCVAQAFELCAGCGDPANGYCKQAHTTPGCNDGDCCATVCTLDSFCCETVWDQSCAAQAKELCGFSCPGDLNNDDIVDGADLGLLLGAWGALFPPAGDLNGDWQVDGADLGLLLGAWGSCPDLFVCDTPGVCGQFPLCADGCKCYTLIDGTGMCLKDQFCAELTLCEDGCPPGTVCVVDSCCEVPVCMPLVFCDGAAAGPAGTPGASDPLRAGDGSTTAHPAPRRTNQQPGR